jgi:transcription elongation factor Elf1
MALPRYDKIVCQFCQQPGHVKVRTEKRAKRKTATRLFGAAVTLGGSAMVTGVSKKGRVTVLHCGNCGMEWDAPKAQP